MKAVILAGGMGSRLSEETVLKPKPLVEVGGRPIIWHIMKLYAAYGIKEFVVCCGYKGNMLKEYFMNYSMYQNDAIFSLKDDQSKYLTKEIEDWQVTLANTGLETLTAGRILRIKEYVKEEPFFLTYGDGVADVDLESLLQCHRKSGKAVTLSAGKPKGRFGILHFDESSGELIEFKEKDNKDQSFTNIGFMVMNPSVFDFLGDGRDMLEGEPFQKLLSQKQLNVYKHAGFFAPMDSVRDRNYLNELWASGGAPWKRAMEDYHKAIG